MADPRRILDRSRRTTNRSSVQSSRNGERVKNLRGPVGDVKIEVLDESGQTIPFDCFDISAVGVYLHSDLLLTEGERLDLKLTLPSAVRAVSIRGEVVRADTGDGFHAPGMGIAFRGIAPEVREQLRSYVARRFVRHSR